MGGTDDEKVRIELSFCVIWCTKTNTKLLVLHISQKKKAEKEKKAKEAAAKAAAGGGAAGGQNEGEI